MKKYTHMCDCVVRFGFYCTATWVTFLKKKKTERYKAPNADHKNEMKYKITLDWLSSG